MEPADSDRYSLIVPEGGEQEQDWMWFAPFGDAFSLLLVVRRFHDLRSFHQRLLKVGPLRGPEVTCEIWITKHSGIRQDIKKVGATTIRVTPTFFIFCSLFSYFAIGVKRKVNS